MHQLPSVSAPSPSPADYFVYILQSHDGALYVGSSNDVGRRLRQHRRGGGAKHTRDHPKSRLVYTEGPMTLAEAVGRERQLKRWSRAKKLALGVGDLDRLREFSRSHT